jgi:hypothetical protein
MPPAGACSSGCLGRRRGRARLLPLTRTRMRCRWIMVPRSGGQSSPGSSRSSSTISRRSRPTMRGVSRPRRTQAASRPATAEAGRVWEFAWQGDGVCANAPTPLRRTCSRHAPSRPMCPPPQSSICFSCSIVMGSVRKGPGVLGSSSLALVRPGSWCVTAAQCKAEGGFYFVLFAFLHHACFVHTIP